MKPFNPFNGDTVNRPDIFSSETVTALIVIGACIALIGIVSLIW